MSSALDFLSRYKSEGVAGYETWVSYVNIGTQQSMVWSYAASPSKPKMSGNLCLPGRLW